MIKLTAVLVANVILFNAAFYLLGLDTWYGLGLGVYSLLSAAKITRTELASILTNWKDWTEKWLSTRNKSLSMN